MGIKVAPPALAVVRTGSPVALAQTPDLNATGADSTATVAAAVGFRAERDGEASVATAVGRSGDRLGIGWAANALDSREEAE